MTTKPFEFKNFAALLDRADITAAEAADIFKTTKPTIYSWRSGTTPANQVMRADTERVVTVIAKAISSGDLPLKGVEKENRLSAIAEAIRKNSGR